jgi:hypothetical protein
MPAPPGHPQIQIKKQGKMILWNSKLELPAYSASIVQSSDGPAGPGFPVDMFGAPIIGSLVRNSNSPNDVVRVVMAYLFGVPMGELIWTGTCGAAVRTL